MFFAMLNMCEIAFAQHNPATRNRLPYDSLLAKSLGADEYGMKEYVMAFLKSGPVKIQDSLQRAVLQRKHLQNIMRLVAEGTLIVAGPFLDNQEMRGIFIFNVKTVEEAKTIAETDPAVKAGALILELHPWYGSAALVEMQRIHKTIEKKSVAD
jgi:uncharacterized protein